MALTIAQNVSNIQAAVTQLTTAAALTRAPTAAQKTAMSNAVSGLNDVIADLNKRKTCAQA